ASADTVSFDALSDSQLVVLDNLSGDDLAAGDWSRLHTYVRDMGGSILVTGGDQSFGLGRYDELPIAPALPVVSAPGSKRAVTLVVVLDVSGSMGEEVGGTAKLAVAKQAIMGLRQVLSRDDRVGVVAFSASPRVISQPVVSAEQWEELRQKMLALDAGGGTRITPALEAAEKMLRTAEGQTVRHVLLLSDGESADFEARKMAEAFRAGKISVSTVATGKQVDREKLSFLARQTGGRFYEMRDLRRLAATFLKDLLQAKHKVVSREPAAVEWKEPRPIWPPRVSPVPDVAYHLITGAKSEARVHLTTTAGTPIAASWRHGLGKVAVLPVSLHESDNAAWTKWPDLPGFLWPIVNWLRARPRPAGWNLTLNQQDATLQIEVRVPAREAAKQALAFSASTVTPRGNLETTPLEHTAPRIFSATIKATEQGTYWVSVQQKDSGGQAWQRESITLGPPAEWRQTGLDEKGLGNIARTTGGTVIEADEQIEGLALMQTGGLQPVGLYLLYAAAAVFVAEICARLLRRD
ncbi:MAG: VWA domain-containing protein, partial [Phycisphaerae bacterium]|nr:VWA domain-containing protein [Phycisphaerae bacterium]